MNSISDGCVRSIKPHASTIFFRGQKTTPRKSPLKLAEAQPEVLESRAKLLLGDCGNQSMGHTAEAMRDEPNCWLSINRAAKILEPGSGSFEIAKERIWDALRETQPTIRSSRLSPIHPLNEYSEAEVKEYWFTADRERDFVRGTQSSTECVQEWDDFLNNGGLLIWRQDIEALDGPRSWQKVSSDLASKCSKQRTNWNLPEAIAWVATRDFEQVTQMGCDASWVRIEGEEVFSGQKVFEDVSQRASVGWLIRSVSLHHCQCGAEKSSAHEAWEKCCCTTLAFNQLWDAVNEDKLAAYDRAARSAIFAAEIPGFALDCQAFTISAPRHPGAVSFRRVDLERLWPQAVKTGDTPQKDKPRLSDAELERWWSKQSNTEYAAVEDLWRQVKVAFPSHHISRDRIRSLAGPRKRGPKPIRVKRLAN